MSLKIRLQRGGATHNPHYRMVVADSRARRDGRFVEVVGTYAPKEKSEDKQFAVNLDRIAYWLGVGALPSDTVRSIIKRARRRAAREASRPTEPEVAQPATAE